MSCVSTEIEYRTIVPAIVHPDFPEAEYITDNKDGTCTVPSEWIVNLSIFKVKYLSIVDYYNKVRALLKEGEK